MLPNRNFQRPLEKRVTKEPAGCPLIVGAIGRPRDIRAVRKLGMQLDEEAIRALKEWKFEPA